MYFVYVLQSAKDHERYYGLTRNLDKRLEEHNKGHVSSTKSRIPFDLVYFEKVVSLSEARKREKYFKSGFGRKYVNKRIKNGPIV